MNEEGLEERGPLRITVHPRSDDFARVADRPDQSIPPAPWLGDEGGKEEGDGADLPPQSELTQGSLPQAPWSSKAGVSGSASVLERLPSAPWAAKPQEKEPEEDTRSMPSIPEALFQGLGAGLTGVGKTAQSFAGYKPEAPESVSPAAAPYEMRDLWSPGRALSKTAYALGSGFPTIATGVAGTVAGGAAGGPPGALAGGTMGAMLGAAVQAVGPIYAEELKKNPDNPDAAWTKAMDHAAISGVFSGVGWAAFPLKFFNGPIKNLLTQALAVQPGVHVAEKTALNQAEGKPLTEGWGQAYAQGAAGTAIPMAGHAGASVAGRGIKNSLNDVIGVNELFRDIQMKGTPMAAETASVEGRAAAKDFANERRQAMYHWNEMHDRLMKVTTPEQRKAMWEAADNESVARQQGMTSADIAARGIGTSTLPPRLKRMLDVLQQDSQAILDEAKNVGIFEGEGLPSYVPRIVAMMGADGTVAKPRSSGNGLSTKPEVTGVSTTTPQMKGRRNLTVEETEAAAKAKLGKEAEVVKDIATLPMATARLQEAVAGRTLINKIEEIGRAVGMPLVAHGAKPEGSWFTIDHPAFMTYRPKFDPKTRKPIIDENGSIVFERVPIYIHPGFKGPLKAVLQTGNNGAVYNGLMRAKAAATTAIMYSPLIHNAVEWGRALPAMPGKVLTGYIYFKGNALRQGYEFNGATKYIWDSITGQRKKVTVSPMDTAISEGLVPIGRRYGIQDITGIMEEPNIKPGRSIFSQALSAPVAPFSERGANAVRRGVDRAGDVWHGTLLWDRVADLQFGLYADFRSKLIRKGFDETTAGRMAAHWANRYAGALPMESMSEMARKVANLTMFSRSFTLGNIGAMKDSLNGLPRDVQAQILRDAGPAMLDKATGYAKRKARSILALDMALAYGMNTALQSGVRAMMTDDTVGDIGREYAQRLHELLQKTKEDPLSVLAHPFASMEDLTEMANNEPTRRDRVLIGHQDDGTAIYARNPAGKIGEEMVGYLTGALDMARRKQGTIVRPLMQSFANDKGFGHKVYNPNKPWYDSAWRIAKHFMLSQVPAESIEGGWDLVTGEGSPDERKLNAAKVLAPLLGATISKGAPGGPAMGQLYKTEEDFKFDLYDRMSEIKKLIKRGKTDQAIDIMDELKVDPKYQRYIIGTTLNPDKLISKRKTGVLYRSGNDEAIKRFERARERQP